MSGTYDLALVMLSWLVATFASATFLHIARQLPELKGRVRLGWQVAGTLVMGVGIWSMHFVGMLAFHLPIDMTFDLWLTLLSVLPAFVGVAIALSLMRRSSFTLRLQLQAALALGAGIGVMHYAGMAAMDVSPPIRYEPAIFALSVVVAVALSWLSLNHVSRQRRVLLGAPVLGSAVAAMHYTAMQAAHFDAAAVCTSEGAALDAHWLAVLVALNAVLLTAITLVATLFNQRLIERDKATIRALQEANRTLEGRARDLADQMTAELRRAESQRRVIMETARIAFWDWDIAADTVHFDGYMLAGGDRPDGVVLTTSQWRERFHPDDREPARHLMLAHLRGEIPRYEAEYRVRDAKGEWRWMLARGLVYARDEAGRATRVHGTKIDIHLNKTVTAVLHEERALFNAGPIIMFRMTSEDGWRLTYLSENAHQLWGYERRQLNVDTPPSSMVDPTDLVRISSEARIALAEGGGRFFTELRFRMADGSYRWHSLHAHTERRDGAVQLCGFLIDVEERKQAMMRAEENQRRLEEVVSGLSASHHERAVHQQTSNLIGSAESMAEAGHIVCRSALALFDGWSGALAILTEPDVMTVEVRWGDCGLPERFALRDCWSLRRGRTHTCTDPAHQMICGHGVGGEGARATICVPLAAGGEMFGSLHLVRDSVSDAEELVGRAERFAEILSLSLSNLRLRTSLHEKAMRDALTGLYNRRYLDETLPRELQRSRRESFALCLAMIDVDHFKRFNDQFGHEAGDHVLRALGAQLRNTVRAYDLACRYGGEELCVVLPACDLNGAMARLDTVRAQVAGMCLEHGGRELPPVTISVGVAQAEFDDSVDTLQRRADLALYDAKRAGRDRVVAAPRGLTVSL